jgi:hypothetical protein
MILKALTFIFGATVNTNWMEEREICLPGWIAMSGLKEKNPMPMNRETSLGSFVGRGGRFFGGVIRGGDGEEDVAEELRFGLSGARGGGGDEAGFARTETGGDEDGFGAGFREMGAAEFVFHVRINYFLFNIKRGY